MADHAAATDPALPQSEPAAFAEVVRYVLAGLITIGWVTISSSTLNAITTVVGMLASLGLTIWTRRKVTPLAAPHDASGVPLASTAPPTPS